MADVSVECDGLGFLRCFCAGDFCACDVDGSPCGGCEDCQGENVYVARNPSVEYGRSDPEEDA